MGKLIMTLGTMMMVLQDVGHKLVIEELYELRLYVIFHFATIKY